MKSMKKLAVLSLLAALGGSAHAGIAIDSITNRSSTPLQVLGQTVPVNGRVFIAQLVDLEEGALVITPEDAGRGVITISQGEDVSNGIFPSWQTLQCSEGTATKEVLTNVSSMSLKIYDAAQYPSVAGLESFIVRPQS